MKENPYTSKWYSKRRKKKNETFRWDQRDRRTKEKDMVIARNLSFLSSFAALTRGNLSISMNSKYSV